MYLLIRAKYKHLFTNERKIHSVQKKKRLLKMSKNEKL